MLRYFAFSVRDFGRSPDYSDFRLNWEIWITFRGHVYPVFHDEPLRQREPANFWVMPPRLRFHWEAESSKVERCVLNFAQIPSPLDPIARQRGYFCRTLEASELVEARGIATAVAEAVRRRDTLSPLVFERALLDLTLLACRREIARPLSTVETEVADRVEHAMAWYKEHFREGPKLEQVAAELHVSVSHLRRLFRLHLGKSPKDVFNTMRLDVATRLMANSASPLKSVAEQSGFQSLADFCRVFKKHFGYAPNRWRRTTNEALPTWVGMAKHPESKRSAAAE